MPTLKGRKVRLPSLAYDSGWIEDYVLVECELLGPAVLALVENVTARGCTWDSPTWEAMYWPHQHDEPLVGAIGVRNVEFVACTFRSVGLASPPEEEERLRAAFGD